ncbi:MAG: hypothetical protein K0Q50_329 [Vampirovibrio sp.]|jgi:hypothetical protein|nr:hypothetical protein [Vampirovibrio sp.]
MPLDPQKSTQQITKSAKPDKPDNDVLQPDTAPGDMPDFAEEFTTAGVDKNYWKKPLPEKGSAELLN